MPQILGRVARAFEPATGLLARMRQSSGVYQELRQAGLEEEPISCCNIWARRPLYYWISCLSNALMLVCGCSGYLISSERDSAHEPKNCARFTIAAICAFPAFLTTGFLAVSTIMRTPEAKYSKYFEVTFHVKFALFAALHNALAFAFMDIYALGLDNPASRFGTSDDIRNLLLSLIIYSSALSALCLAASVLLTFSAAARSRKVGGLLSPAVHTRIPDEEEIHAEAISIKPFDTK